MQPGEPVEVAREYYDQAAKEAHYRAVVHCAYFGLFQYVMNHPLCANFAPDKSEEDHRNLIDFCKRHSDPTVVKVGIRVLPSLRTARNHADYHTDKPFPREKAERVLEDAEQVYFEWLPEAYRSSA